MGLAQWALAHYERRVLRKGLHQVSIAGRRLTFKVHDGSEIGLLDWFKSSESPLMERILDVIQEGDTILDVGANVGVVSLLLASVGRARGVTVHAFEPNPQTAKRASENVDLNQCGNVTVHQLALSARCGFLNLHTNSNNHGQDSLIGEKFHTNVVRVPAETADAITRKLKIRPDIMKIDVEGAELDVLHGSKEILARGLVRELFIEVHPQRLATAGRDEDTVVSWLAELGYHSQWRHGRYAEVHHHFRRRETSA